MDRSSGCSQPAGRLHGLAVHVFELPAYSVILEVFGGLVVLF